jgi:hypothetical protein
MDARAKEGSRLRRIFHASGRENVVRLRDETPPLSWFRGAVNGLKTLWYDFVSRLDARFDDRSEYVDENSFMSPVQADLMKEFLLESFPNPGRKGCPDEETIKSLAERRLPASHPAMMHLGSCSECFAEYGHYRQDWKESGKRSGDQ